MRVEKETKSTCSAYFCAAFLLFWENKTLVVTLTINMNTVISAVVITVVQHALIFAFKTCTI